MPERSPDANGAEVVLQLKRQLGTVLQDRRYRLGLTQRGLSDAAGISLKYLGEIERGEANPTIETLARVAWVMNWDPWMFFGERQTAISRNTHALLTADLERAQQQLGTISAWLNGLNPAARDSPADEATAMATHNAVPATTQRPPGRPRLRHIVRDPRP